MQDRLEDGLVVRVTGGEVRVRVGDTLVACSLRGRFRVKQRDLQIVAGDRVRVRRDPGVGPVLEEVRPRESWLSRYVEREGGERLIVANVERLFVVASIEDPPLHPSFLDRVLGAAEWGRAPATLVLNKVDLGKAGRVAELRTVYAGAGYEVVETCATSGAGVDALAERVDSGIYAFVGQSGVGKSSLLNRLDPACRLEVRAVAERTGRGRHTTTFSQLFPFRGGYLADTPGMQTFRFPAGDETDVAACFPEIAERSGGCRFDPCTHSHEPGCAIKADVEAGRVAGSRYASYLDILAEVRGRARNRGR